MDFREIKEFLRNVVENMGLEVTMELTNKDDRVTIRMFSNKDYILIGKEGSTLKALETLAKQYKRVTVVTNHIEKLRKIEKEIYEKNGF